MTDPEIICSWMEEKPSTPVTLYRESPAGWWRKNDWDAAWSPVLEYCQSIKLLGRLHEVEERLTEEQWDAYELSATHWRDGHSTLRSAIHATADQKIKALAAVIKESPHA